MQRDLLEILRCPKTGRRLRLQQPEYRGGRICSGWLVSEDGGHRYAIRDFIPRFVPESNYADNFGMQWNKFRQTQLDSHSGLPISADRFWRATSWNSTDITGQWVLDAGCGAGRFAEVALQAGAKVIALDYSSAVDACYANLKHYLNLHVVQGDICTPPFPTGFFPYVYCLGVLQHTPNPQHSFGALLTFLGPGGKVAIDIYERNVRSLLSWKYLLRPVTTHVRKDRLFYWVEHAVHALLPAAILLRRIGGSFGARLLPVLQYSHLGLPNELNREWAVLDTFDMYSPVYDIPQTVSTVRDWFEIGELENVLVERGPNGVVGRGRKKVA